MADSIEEHGQEESITVIPIEDDPFADFELIDGERRWRVMKDILRRPVRAIVRANVERGIDQFVASTVANFCREGHTPLEIAYALERIKKERGWTQERIAKLFGKTGGWVSQYLSLLRLHLSVQRLMDPDLPKERQLSFSVAIMLVNFPDEEQMRMAALISKHKWRLNRARQEIRKRAEELEVAGTAKRPRLPYNDYRLLEGLFRKISQDAEAIVSLKATRFDEMFAKRTALERAVMLKKVDECIDSLSLIRQQIERTDPKLKAM